MFFGVGVSCRNLFSFVVYLYVNGSGSTTSVREERASFLLLFTCYYVVSVWGGVPLPLGAWDGLRYFIVALSEPSI